MPERGLTMKKWRLDDAYGKVYEYDEDSNAYIFYCTYFAAGIKDSMSECEKIRLIEEDYYND